MELFTNRVFGCVIVKAQNANYNADFTGQPRTLPDGRIYATDKVIKYAIRNYLKINHPDEKVFYSKSLNENLQPRDLDERYESYFGKVEKKKDNRKEILKNLLSCIDVRLFGATYASKEANFSLHGPVQLTHALNIYPNANIYTEQISSPFRNSSDKKDDSMQTTLGSQCRLEEGHYVHHFSINPHNIVAYSEWADGKQIDVQDINYLKEGLTKGVTFYDSTSKAGCENELLLWVELKQGSMLVLPSFIDMVGMDEKGVIDLMKVKTLFLNPKIQEEVVKIELYYNKETTTIINLPEGAVCKEII